MLKRVSSFFLWNVITQMGAAGAGLIITRALSYQDYSMYTVMMSLTGAISVLTKSSLHVAFSAILGRHWPDKARARSMIAVIAEARFTLACFVIPVIMLVGATVLTYLKTGVYEIAVLITMLLAFFIADFKTGIVDHILYFANMQSKVQFLDAQLSGFRIAIIAVLAYGKILDVNSAVFLMVAISAIRIFPVYRWIRAVVGNCPTKILEEDRSETILIVKRLLPTDIYKFLVPQINLYFLSALSSAQSVSELGALNRYAQLFLPLQGFLFAFIIPAIVQSRFSPKKIIAVTCVYALPYSVFLWLSLEYPKYVLKIIGSRYSNLAHELYEFAMMLMLTSVVQFVWVLISHRGWNRWTWVQIPLGIIWCATAPLLINVGTVTGAIWLYGGTSFGVAVSVALDLADKRNHVKDRLAFQPRGAPLNIRSNRE